MRLTVGVGPKFPDAPPSIFPGAPSGARQGRSLARLARNLPGTAGVRTRRVSSAARAKRETLERPAPPAEASPGTQLPVPTPGEPRAPGRLWSSLDASIKHQPGSLVGATALVAGTTVGAGVLALPTVASTAGFVPSTTTLLVCCGASIATGMVRAPRPPAARAPPPRLSPQGPDPAPPPPSQMIAEVALNTMCELGAGGVGLRTSVERTLGKGGTAVFTLAYLFLHYCLLVAYISKGGELVSDLAGALPLPAVAPEWGSLGYVAGWGALCFYTEPRVMDRINTTLVGGVVAAFLGLLAVALPSVEPGLLLEGSDWGAVPDSVPVIALAYVYHNVVPVICTALEGDRDKVRAAIVLGSVVPMAMFVLWDAAALGLPGAVAGGAGDAVAALEALSPAANGLVAGFSFLALTTSFVGFVFGLSDFIGGALGKPSGRPQAVPYALTLAPPFLLSLALKDVFLTALDKAGTFGVLMLFGVLPPAMVWQERYGKSGTGTGDAAGAFGVGELLPGGRFALGLVGGSAAVVIAREALQQLGVA